MPDPKGIEIKVSRNVYIAVRDALAKEGKKLESAGRNIPIIIEPDDKLIDPIDWQLANVRKDACAFAAQIFQHTQGDANAEEFVKIAEAMVEFIIDRKSVTKKEGWGN